MFTLRSTKELKWLLFASIFYFLCILWTHQAILIDRTHIPYGDNYVHYVSYQIFFSHVLNGQLPLWSYHHNGGSALWHLTEIHSMYDPSAWIVFLVAKLSGWSGFYAYQVLVVVWLTLLSLGVYCLSRQLGTSTGASLLAGQVAASSLLNVIVISQANGHLEHAVFAPFVALGLMRCYRSPTICGGFVLGVFTGIWAGSYHLALCLMITWLFLSFSFPHVWRSRASVSAEHGKCALAALFGLLPFAVGTGFAGLYCLQLVDVARIAAPKGNSGHLPTLLRSLVVGVPSARARYVLEKCFFLGIVSYVVLLAGAGRRLFSLSARRISRETGFCLLFLAAVLLFYLYAQRWVRHVSPDGVFLNYRNWRFFYPYLLIPTAVLVGRSADFLFGGLRRAFPLRELLLAILTLGLAAEMLYRNGIWIRKLSPKTPAWFTQSEPPLTLPSQTFPFRRALAFEISDFLPFHKEGPAVWGAPVLGMDLEGTRYYENRKRAGFDHYPPASHWFRERGYFNLFEDNKISESMRSDWGGVTRPTARVYYCVGLMSDPSTPRGDVAYLETTAFGNALARGLFDASKERCPWSASYHVTLKEIGSHDLEINVHTARAGVLYLSDGYDPSWKASVNGQAEAVFRSNLAFKGTLLNAGSNQAILSYRPVVFIACFWLRTLWMMALVAVLLPVGSLGFVSAQWRLAIARLVQRIFPRAQTHQ